MKESEGIDRQVDSFHIDSIALHSSDPDHSHLKSSGIAPASIAPSDIAAIDIAAIDIDPSSGFLPREGRSGIEKHTRVLFNISRAFVDPSPAVCARFNAASRVA